MLRVRFPMVSLEFFVDSPTGCAMALGLTQSLIEMSTRNISWGLCRANKLTNHLHVPTVLKSGSLNHLVSSGPVQSCNGIALPCLLFAFFIPRSVVFIRVAREPAKNMGCGPSPKTLDTDGCSVRLHCQLKYHVGRHRTVVPQRKWFIICSRYSRFSLITYILSADVAKDGRKCGILDCNCTYLWSASWCGSCPM
jgi:hypothetical protein